ncbi:MAG: glycosyltransferase family 87 protein [Alphaproteobacteria bacterium]
MEKDKLSAVQPARWLSLVALAATTLFVLTIATAAWVYHTQRPGVDFAGFWAAGRLARFGHPELAYHAEAHRAVEMIVANMGGLVPFPYPPPFLFAVIPFAFQPFWLAYLAWILITAGLFLWASRPYLGPRFAFAHPAAIVNAVIGQNGFLTSGAFLFGLSALTSRPFLAGAIFGLLIIKPQLAVLVPVALIAAREWRAIGGAALSGAVLLALALLAFGVESYRGFLAMTGEYAGFLSDARWNWAEQASVFAFLRYFGLPQGFALGAQGVAALIAAILTWKVWSSHNESRGAVLAAATLLVPPYVFTYDSLLLTLPIAVLLRDSARPWRIAFLWLLLLLPLLGQLGFYPGPNTVPAAAALCLWWLLSANRAPKMKAAAP